MTKESKKKLLKKIEQLIDKNEKFCIAAFSKGEEVTEVVFKNNDLTTVEATTMIIKMISDLKAETIIESFPAFKELPQQDLKNISARILLSQISKEFLI